MSIEGLGEKFQAARQARGLSLDEAARLTKIRQSRLAELEADDFSNFPSLAYAKGFLQIYGKFLDIDVSPYLDAFETSEHITVDGYSYLQDNPVPRPRREAVVRDVPQRTSLMPLIIGIIVLAGGIWFIKLVLNVQRITPRQPQAAASVTPAATVATIMPSVAPTIAESRPAVIATPPVIASASPSSTPAPAVIARALPVDTPAVSTPEPTIRRAVPVRPEDVAAAEAYQASEKVNRVDIRPLKRTHLEVTVDDEPSFERWISPGDAPVQLLGRRFSVHVLDRDAVQIRKNGRIVSADDADVTVGD
ncbi:MAG: helix-turn-helix domain-containing protein [Verrucomicrobia bacterium]|nr:helix-turn-helix domain-containing protein [Verrucomicrobiota bacterium]